MNFLTKRAARRITKVLTSNLKRPFRSSSRIDTDNLVMNLITPWTDPSMYAVATLKGERKKNFEADDLNATSKFKSKLSFYSE